MKQMRLKEVQRAKEMQTEDLNSNPLIPTAAITSLWHMIRDQKCLITEERRRWPLSLNCQRMDPPREPLPSLSPPGQDLHKKSKENKDHISEKQWPCWIKENWAHTEDKSWVPAGQEWQPALLLLLQRSLESMCMWSFEAHSAFPSHLPILSPSDYSPSQTCSFPF